MSPGFSTAVIETGCTFFIKSGWACSGANTSISEVLLKAELGKWLESDSAGEFDGRGGRIYADTVGGANQTVFWPTT